MDLHKQIEALCQSLSSKITSKNESLILRHEHFALYENTLNEKYDPVFEKMREIVKERSIDYQTALLKQLNTNMERVKTEKSACSKLSKSMAAVGGKFSEQLQEQLEIIKKKDA